MNIRSVSKYVGLAVLASTAFAYLMMGGKPDVRQQPQSLVIVDKDWAVSGTGYVSEDLIVQLLRNPRIRLLGFTSLTGDNWRDEGVVSLLRFLEIMTIDAPVTKGAVFPLLNNPVRLAAWEAKFGSFAWHGAWNDRSVQKSAHASQPFHVTKPREGWPTRQVSSVNSVTFLIDMVHKYPHQVTIYAAGPLTNIALAVRQDPEFAGLVKTLFIQGSSARNSRDEAEQRAEFNFAFDPEAAAIVLGTKWDRLVILGAAAGDVLMTAELRREVERIDTPAARYASSNAAIGLPLWTQLGAAIIADPGIARKAEHVKIEVDTSGGVLHGRTRTWPAQYRGAPSSARDATLITHIDQPRFMRRYLEALQISTARP